MKNNGQDEQWLREKAAIEDKSFVSVGGLAAQLKPSGPYFTGQKPCECGCYYPDVTRIRDENGERVLHCIHHGEVRVKFKSTFTDAQEIPSEAWREAERERLRCKE